MRKLDLRVIGFINSFENITGAKVKDAFFDKNETLVFVVNDGEMGKAIGKNGANVKRVGFVMKKKIKIIEYNENPLTFVKNAIYPIQADSIELENDNTIVINVRSTESKAIILGRSKSNLAELNSTVQRYFEQFSVKVA